MSRSWSHPAVVQSCCRVIFLRVALAVIAYVWVLLSPAAAQGQAQPVCPWLNEATASGVVGGPVTVSVTPKGDKGDADCLFVRRVNSSTISLRIDVETMSGPSLSLTAYTAPCNSPLAPVKAIGNEAFACSIPPSKKSGLSEQITSRVRERAFFVRLSSNEPSADSDELRLKANKVAQQVAGFLF
jgi:hypothetical protein